MVAREAAKVAAVIVAGMETPESPEELYAMYEEIAEANADNMAQYMAQSYMLARAVIASGTKQIMNEVDAEYAYMVADARRDMQTMAALRGENYISLKTTEVDDELYDIIPDDVPTRTKTRIFVDWSDGVRGPAWYVTGWQVVPASPNEIAAAGAESIIEYVYTA